MLKEPEDFLPYASPANMISLIERLRNRGLPDPLTNQELERLSIPAGSTSKTLQALRFLKLVGEDGYQTQSLRDIERAASADYPPLLSAILKASYNKVFQVIDPLTASSTDLQDAFRHYEPRTQSNRMIALFVGLCKEAGLIPSESTSTKSSVRRPTKKRPKGGVLPAAAPSVPQPVAHGSRVSAIASYPTLEPASQLTELFSVLIRQVPSGGTWPESARNQWLAAFTSGLDLFVQVEK